MCASGPSGVSSASITAMLAESWLPRSGLARAVLATCIGFFGLLIWWPIFQTLWLSLQFIRPGEAYWVGLENYRFLLFEDPLFWKSLSVTFSYVGLTVPGVVLLGLFLAVVLNALKN